MRWVNYFFFLIGLLLVIILGRSLLLTANDPERTHWQSTAVYQNHVERLSEALTFQTIVDESYHEDPTQPLPAFDAFHDFLRHSYPLTFGTLQVELIGHYSLLITWPGQSANRPGILILAHQDVVPIAHPQQWQHNPFSATVADGKVFGRGALDDKAAMMAALEAVEALLRQGFKPSAPVYLAFGHDEEIGGMHGATAIAAHLKDNGTAIAMIIDEGGAILQGKIPSVAAPVAMVGIAEKGYLTLNLAVAASGGHSSMPPQQTAIEILAAALTRLNANQRPMQLAGATRLNLESLSPHMTFTNRVITSNLWLFSPLVARLMAEDSSTAAMLHTTTATTLIDGGSKDNVLPAYATASVNFRILPGDSSDAIIRHVTESIDDPRVAIEVGPERSEPSPVSPIDNPAFTYLKQAILNTRQEPDLLVAPYLMLGATDARHYQKLSNNAYRFMPVFLQEGELDTIHGSNEAIRISDYEAYIQYYLWIIEHLEQLSSTPTAGNS